MDLGCLDLGCLDLFDEKQTKNDSFAKSPTGETSDSSSDSAKARKNKSPKGSPPSGVNALNRFTSQIKKPPHRKTSPLNWFPRKKVDSYLKRKIKLIQEAGGMNDTLDETLGHSNPHYCRVEREKMAVREAACKVMEARKAAMVEASWCRILQAARIPNKEADALLLKAEEEVAEAFEAAKAKGVIMYDTPDRPWKHFEIETSSARRKGSTTHTVKASFETAFEVDKQVAAAVKAAFVRLGNCPSFDKDEFKDLLRKISEHPESHEVSESDRGSELETGPQDDNGFSSERTHKKLSPQKFKGIKLVDMMLERLKCLKEEELASLATIVATCGLNAALADTKDCDRTHDKVSATSMDYFVNGAMGQKQVEPELPSLDKFLVKKMTKLEREVQEAKDAARKAESDKRGAGNLDNSHHCNGNVDDKTVSVDNVPDLASELVKHSSKLEKEIEEAKRNQKLSDMDGSTLGGRTQKHGKGRQLRQEYIDVPSLDKCLIKHVSRLEREVQEAKNRRRDAHNIPEGGHSSVSVSGEELEKENVDSNKPLPLQLKQNGYVKHTEKFSAEVTSQSQHEKGDGDIEQQSSLDKIMVKPLHRLEREKMQAISQGKDSERWSYKRQQGKNTATEGESLDKVLVKHVSRLEKEKMRLGTNEVLELKKKDTIPHLVDTGAGGLDQILVKHKSRLEKEKATASQVAEDGNSYSMSRRKAREREMLETWGGIGLGHSIRPHVSRLEREKAAWRKAEEEERTPALE